MRARHSKLARSLLCCCYSAPTGSVSEHQFPTLPPVATPLRASSKLQIPLSHPLPCRPTRRQGRARRRAITSYHPTAISPQASTIWQRRLMAFLTKLSHRHPLPSRHGRMLPQLRPRRRGSKRLRVGDDIRSMSIHPPMLPLSGASFPCCFPWHVRHSRQFRLSLCTSIPLATTRTLFA